MNSVSSHRPPGFSPCMFCQKEADYSVVSERHLLYPGLFCEACLDVFSEAIECLHSQSRSSAIAIASPVPLRFVTPAGDDKDGSHACGELLEASLETAQTRSAEASRVANQQPTRAAAAGATPATT